MSETVRAGVIGVGNMGRHHARVYGGLPDVELVGVHDADADRAETVAESVGTSPLDRETLLAASDVVSVAVPLEFHYPVARECIEAGVAPLVEKPFVDELDRGRRLIEQANDAGVPLGVGHVERFNPAVGTLAEIVPDLDVIAVSARRLGPGPDRPPRTSVAEDLLVHDIDVVRWLLDDDIAAVSATGAAENRYVDSTLRFDSGVVAELTASRVTQQKVRELSITAADCRVVVDYLDRSVRIHRRSVPEYVGGDEDVRYRHEGIVERPTVERGEPLRRELSAFVDAVRLGDEPPVSGEDGLTAVAVAQQLDELAADGPAATSEVRQA